MVEASNSSTCWILLVRQIIMIRSPSLGACNPHFCHRVFTDQSIFSLNLSKIQIPIGTSVTNCNHKHGVILVCQHDVSMFMWGCILLSSPKHAHVNWNWAILREKTTIFSSHEVAHTKSYIAQSLTWSSISAISGVITMVTPRRIIPGTE